MGYLISIILLLLLIPSCALAIDPFLAWARARAHAPHHVRGPRSLRRGAGGAVHRGAAVPGPEKNCISPGKPRILIGNSI